MKENGDKKRVSFAPSQSNSMEQLYDNHDSRSKYYDGTYQKEQTRSSNQQMTSLTGEKINANEFSHNNMQPFFGSKVRGASVDSKISEGILDNMNGSGSQNIRKTEQAPLFKPQDNIQYANGAPNIYFKMAGVKLFYRP